MRTPIASARAILERDDPYQITKRNLGSQKIFICKIKQALETVDLSYKDPFGPAPTRPKTGSRLGPANEDLFEDVDLLDEDLLPDGE